VPNDYNLVGHHQALDSVGSPLEGMLSIQLAHRALPEKDPKVGELVQVRSRRWLVEEVDAGTPGSSSVVRLACAEDDAQGEIIEVFWNYEADRRILRDEGWGDLANRGFDPPRLFAAFLHTLRWSCVTATDPNLFQAPFRAGIKIEAYQMEPLRKALRLPRVNLFIADDTGLGKTIEAGLIARELLLRKKVKTIVVAAPPSVLEQWKAELEERFGLVFEIFGRDYLSRVRRERGFAVNPWRTHSRFLISHHLLIDPGYADPMREWLEPFQPGSLLILDEAHHAAPSSGGGYGIESKLTRAVRELSSFFEHRLFLSATPHNGHSSSFSTLLELLDPYRFTRGVKVRKPALEEVMVRRLKEDLRSIQGGFAKRVIVRHELANLPLDSPELVLSRLLDEYRSAREQRFASSSRRAQAAAGLLMVGLQQRLLSSVEAFARSLAVHRATVERHWQRDQPGAPELQAKADSSQGEFSALLSAPGPDDERAEWSGEALEAEEAKQVKLASIAAEAGMSHQGRAEAMWRNELRLLDEMELVANAHRHLPDAKARRLVDWIRENLCPGLAPLGQVGRGAPARWNERRVLIFTENREGTKRWLRQFLEQAIDSTDRSKDRLAVIDGLTAGPLRQEIQRRFNSHPSKDPLRILLATDAAREGLNFQAHCHDLFHFDLPWNPGRIEQRNGRIDRKLQNEPVVFCHYFVLPQRVEDHVLEVLVRKTETIKKELGSLSKVIEDDIERRLSQGIRHCDAEELARAIEAADLDEERKRVGEEELEAARKRQEDLKAQVAHCQDLLEASRNWTSFEAGSFREALNCSLGLLGSTGLRAESTTYGQQVYRFPPLDRRAETDSSWAGTLDTLRVPRQPGQKLADWRREAPIRPVIFEDADVLTDELVHLHLEQRVAQRLLARFRSQGFVHHDLSRACLVQATDSLPRVILLGRLSLFGQNAERLHEEIVALAARWVEPSQRRGPLQAYARSAEAEAKTLELLETSLRAVGREPNEVIRRKLLEAAKRDVEELLPQLEPRALELAAGAQEKLRRRGDREAKDFAETVARQRDRVEDELAKWEHGEQDDGRRLAREEAELRQQSLFEDENQRRAAARQRLEERKRALEDARRQLDTNVKSWRRRLEQFAVELASEPQRIREHYEVRARRVEPLGVIYLWPESN
jgi:superfamily II DNA or RNA helicase